MELTKEQREAVVGALQTAQVELGDCADFLSELASRGLKIVPVEEWRDMESAPKDGTPVIGWAPSGVAYVCWFRFGVWVHHETPPRRLLDEPGGEWTFQPTLWAPLNLPAAPETAETRG